MKHAIFALFVILGLLSNIPSAEAQSRDDEAGLSEFAKGEKRAYDERQALRAQTIQGGIDFCDNLQYVTPPDFNNPPDLDAARKKKTACLYSLYNSYCSPVSSLEICSRLWVRFRWSMNLEEEREFDRKRSFPSSNEERQTSTSEGFDQEFLAQAEATEEEYQVLFEALELLEQSELEALGEQLE